MRSAWIGILLVAAGIGRAGADVPQENVRLTVEQGSPFVAGDTVRFSATVEDGRGRPLRDFSKYLYVELVDPFGKVRERVKIKESEGRFSGYVALDRELPESTYTLAAYTMYMQNRGAEHFCRQPLEVRSIYSYKYKIEPEFAGNTMTVRLSEAETGKPTESESLTLYGPQGLIADAGRKKSAYRFRLPPDVATVKVKFDNFEKFLAVPVDSTAARLEFFPEGGTLIAGVSNAVAVRASDPDGRPMSLGSSIVDSEGNTLTEFRTDSLGLAKVYFLPVEGREYSASVGARTFTLGTPAAEGDTTALQVVGREDRLIVSARGKIPAGAMLEANVGGVTELLERAANFPLSIAAAGLSPGAVEFTLLSADGEVISSRAIYNATPKERSARDAAMIAATPEPRTTDRFPVEIGGEISGIIKSRWRGKPMKNAQINILAPEIGLAVSAVTDKEGRFCVNGIDWPDGTLFACQATNSKGEREHNFELSTDTFPTVRPLPVPVRFNRYEPIEGDPMLHSGIMLNEIIVTARHTPEETMENMYKGLGARQVSSEDIELKSITSYEQAIRTIPSLRIVNGRVVSSRGPTSLYGEQPEVEFCVGGVIWKSAFTQQGANGLPNYAAGDVNANRAMEGSAVSARSENTAQLMTGNMIPKDLAVDLLNTQWSQIQEFEGTYPFHMVESITYLPPQLALIYSNNAAHSGGILMVTLKSAASRRWDENLFIRVHQPLGYQR